MPEEIRRKYSVAIKIHHHNGYHVDYSLFDALVLEEYNHTNVTRAHIGKLRNGASEFIEFIKRLKPHIILCDGGVIPLPSKLIHEMLMLGYGWKSTNQFEGYCLPDINPFSGFCIVSGIEISDCNCEQCEEGI